MNQTELEFASWWASIESVALRRAWRFTGSQDAARDVVQEVAVFALLRNRQEKFESQEHLRKWVATRVRWVAIDRFHDRFLKAISIDEEPELGDSPTQERELIASELRAAIEKLPPRQKAALQASLRGQSTTETARDLKVSEATVRSLQRFARGNLATILESRNVATETKERRKKWLRR